MECVRIQRGSFFSSILGLNCHSINAIDDEAFLKFSLFTLPGSPFPCGRKIMIMICNYI
jgi:hypothetical protein